MLCGIAWGSSALYVGEVIQSRTERSAAAAPASMARVANIVAVISSSVCEERVQYRAGVEGKHRFIYSCTERTSDYGNPRAVL